MDALLGGREVGHDDVDVVGDLAVDLARHGDGGADVGHHAVGLVDAGVVGEGELLQVLGTAGIAAGRDDDGVGVDVVDLAVVADSLDADDLARVVEQQPGAGGLKHRLAAESGVGVHQIVEVAVGQSGAVDLAGVPAGIGAPDLIGGELEGRGEGELLKAHGVHPVDVVAGHVHKVGDDGGALVALLCVNVVQPLIVEHVGVHKVAVAELLYLRGGIDGHRAAGQRAGAAVLGARLDHERVRAGLLGLQGGQTARAAAADDEHLRGHVDRVRVRLEIGRRRVPPAHGGKGALLIHAGGRHGLLQGVGDAALDGVGGRGRAADGVDRQRLLGQDARDHQLDGRAADLRGLAAAVDVDRHGGDRAVLDLNRHGQLRVEREAPLQHLIAAVGQRSFARVLAERREGAAEGGEHGLGRGRRAGVAVDRGRVKVCRSRAHIVGKQLVEVDDALGAVICALVGAFGRQGCDDPVFDAQRHRHIAAEALCRGRIRLFGEGGGGAQGQEHRDSQNKRQDFPDVHVFTLLY